MSNNNGCSDDRRDDYTNKAVAAMVAATIRTAATTSTGYPDVIDTYLG